MFLFFPLIIFQPSEILITYILDHLIFFHSSWILCSGFLHPFSLCVYIWVISITLSLGSLILSWLYWVYNVSVKGILQLSHFFFISRISIWFFLMIFIFLLEFHICSYMPSIFFTQDFNWFTLHLNCQFILISVFLWFCFR